MRTKVKVLADINYVADHLDSDDLFLQMAE